MSPLKLFWLFAAPTKGWSFLVQSKPSIHQLYLLHVMPFSLIPALMVYFSGSQYGGSLLPALSNSKLFLVAIIIFVVQIVAVPVMGAIIRQLAEVAEIQPSYHDAFTLAAVAPTPLWMAPVFLFIPSISINLIVISLALLATIGLIYYGVPVVFRLQEKGRAMLMFGAVLTAGITAWVFLMVATLVVWGSIQNINFVLPY